MLSLGGTFLEPFVLLAVGDYWTSVVLRTELIERGYEVHRIASVSAVLLRSDVEGIRPGVVVVEQRTLAARDRLVLEVFRAIDTAPAIVLLSSAGAEPPEGPWDLVLHRPITVGAVADAIHELASRRSSAPATERPDMVSVRGFDVRLGPPWPKIHCPRCAATRHGYEPTTWRERELVRVALVKFALEHEQCAREQGHAVRT